MADAKKMYVAGARILFAGTDLSIIPWPSLPAIFGQQAISNDKGYAEACQQHPNMHQRRP